MALYWAGMAHHHPWDAMFADVAVAGVEMAWLGVPRFRAYPLLFVRVIGGWLLFGGFWLSARLPWGHAEWAVVYRLLTHQHWGMGLNHHAFRT